MRACVLTQKSEEAPASSASLLATPMSQDIFLLLQLLLRNTWSVHTSQKTFKAHYLHHSSGTQLVPTVHVSQSTTVTVQSWILQIEPSPSLRHKWKVTLHSLTHTLFASLKFVQRLCPKRMRQPKNSQPRILIKCFSVRKAWLRRKAVSLRQSLGYETRLYRSQLEGTLPQPAATLRRNDLKGKFSVQVCLLSGQW